MKAFYDGLSSDEKRALAGIESWAAAFDEDELVAVATRDVSDMSPDDVINQNDHVTFLRFVTAGGDVKIFSFAHDYALDLTKLKPVEYGLSNDAVIDNWSILEWVKARDAALAQAWPVLDPGSRPGLMYEFVQFETGWPVQL